MQTSAECTSLIGVAGTTAPVIETSTKADEMSKFYHGTSEGELSFEDCAKYGTCFATDYHTAAEYAECVTNGGGFIEDELYDEEEVRVYSVEIDIDEDRIATAEDIEEITDEDATAIWEVIDRPDVLDAIESAGFDAIRFKDDSPQGGEHDTLRIVGDVDIEVSEVEILEKMW